jgi:hypothetical protein
VRAEVQRTTRWYTTADEITRAVEGGQLGVAAGWRGSKPARIDATGTSLFSIEHPKLGTLRLWLLPAPDLCDVGLSLSRKTSWIAAPFVKSAMRRRLQRFDAAADAYFRDAVEELAPEVRRELRALPRRAREQLGRS